MKALIYKDFTTTKTSIGLMTLIMAAIAFVFNNEGQLEFFPLTFILLPTILWESCLESTPKATLISI